ncbi:DNA replication and repair protein RecF [bacterium HR35]|nr:DNA replication and repair protein RecF [bacterium HR35]
MIKNLKIENFKSIKSVEIDCKKINVFIGEPNTGKSNILEALGLISFVQYFGKYIGGNSSDVLKKFVRFKYIQDLFFNKDVSKEVIVSFPEEVFKINQVSISSFALTFNNQNLVSFDNVGNLNSPFQQFQSKYDIKFFRYFYRINFPSKLSGGLLPPDGENLVEAIRTNPELMDLIGELLRDFGYELLLRETEGEIEIVRKFRATLLSYPYNSISDTLQRLIFYLTAIKTNKNSVLVFEEPEAHSFPYYVSSLSEIIANDTNNNQYFISTHNPYFLISLLEKTAYEDINVFITKLEEYETKLFKVSEKGIKEMLSLDKDLFLNLDEFINKK